MSLLEKLFSKSADKCRQESLEIYQIKEFDGEIWITFNSSLVCPADMFKTEPVEALAVIRDLYVKRNAADYAGV